MFKLTPLLKRPVIFFTNDLGGKLKGKVSTLYKKKCGKILYKYLAHITLSSSFARSDYKIIILEQKRKEKSTLPVPLMPIPFAKGKCEV